MARYIDADGNVQEEGFLGGLHDKPGIFGTEKDTNWLGQPNVERDIFGQPKEATDWLGQQIHNDEGQPLYESRGSGGGGGGGAEGAAVLAVLALVAIVAVAAIWLAAVVLKALFQLLALFYRAWRTLTLAYPTQMLIVHLLLGMGAVYAGLGLAEFPVTIRAAGMTLVPVIWGWLWLTQRLPMILMPLNAAGAGAGLYFGAEASRADWEPTWSRLTAGLPLLSHLSEILALLPVAIWFWQLGSRRWPRAFHLPNLALTGMALWFVLMRVWTNWQPTWDDWIEPVPAFPPTGLLLLLLPIGIWLWSLGHVRWPLWATAFHLVLFGGLLGLSAVHTEPSWQAAWLHWAGGSPLVDIPITLISLAPVAAWSWNRASHWRPELFVLPNLLIAGGIGWLVLDRTRAAWTDDWQRLWHTVPLRPDPALIALALPVGLWAWRNGHARWPRQWVYAQLAAITLAVVWPIERTRAGWESEWNDFSGSSAPDPALIMLILPVAIYGWRQARRRWQRHIDVASWIVATLLLGWLSSRIWPAAGLEFVAVVALLPVGVYGWHRFVSCHRRIGWAMTLLPLVAILAGVAFLPEAMEQCAALVGDWLESQGVLSA